MAAEQEAWRRGVPAAPTKMQRVVLFLKRKMDCVDGGSLCKRQEGGEAEGATPATMAPAVAGSTSRMAAARMRVQLDRAADSPRVEVGGSLIMNTSTEIAVNFGGSEDGDSEERAAVIGAHFEDIELALKISEVEHTRHKEGAMMVEARLNELRATRSALISLQPEDILPIGAIAVDIFPNVDGGLQQSAATIDAHIEDVNLMLEGLQEELKRHSQGTKAAEARVEELHATRRETRSRELELERGSALAVGAATKVTDNTVAGKDEDDAQSRAAVAIGAHIEDIELDLKGIAKELKRYSEVMRAAKVRRKELRTAVAELVSLRPKDGEEVDEHGVLVMQQEPLSVLKVVEAKVRKFVRHPNNLARFHLASGDVTKGWSPPQAEPHDDDDDGDEEAFRLPAERSDVIKRNPMSAKNVFKERAADFGIGGPDEDIEASAVQVATGKKSTHSTDRMWMPRLVPSAESTNRISMRADVDGALYSEQEFAEHGTAESVKKAARPVSMRTSNRRIVRESFANALAVLGTDSDDEDFDFSNRFLSV